MSAQEDIGRGASPSHCRLILDCLSPLSRSCLVRRSPGGKRERRSRLLTHSGFLKSPFAVPQRMITGCWLTAYTFADPPDIRDHGGSSLPSVCMSQRAGQTGKKQMSPSPIGHDSSLLPQFLVGSTAMSSCVLSHESYCGESSVDINISGKKGPPEPSPPAMARFSPPTGDHHQAGHRNTTVRTHT